MVNDKTTKMREVEKRLGGQQLEKAIPELINQRGFSATAEELKLSKATLNYWMLKLGLRLIKVALGPGEKYVIYGADEEIEIKRKRA